MPVGVVKHPGGVVIDLRNWGMTMAMDVTESDYEWGHWHGFVLTDIGWSVNVGLLDQREYVTEIAGRYRNAATIYIAEDYV